MRDLDQRIEAAQDKAEQRARWAQEADDEAMGAETCGLHERAEKLREQRDQWNQDADVWAATAGKLTAAKRIAGDIHAERPWGSVAENLAALRTVGAFIISTPKLS